MSAPAGGGGGVQAGGSAGGREAREELAALSRGHELLRVRERDALQHFAERRGRDAPDIEKI